MILTCPSCGTRYQVDGARFAAPGRNVRCAKCSHVWFQGPLEAEREPEPEIEPVVEMPAPFRPSAEAWQDDAPATPEQKTARVADMVAAKIKRGSGFGGLKALYARAGSMLGWLVLAVIVMGLAFGFLQYRNVIASLWPQSSTFYRALGLTVNVRGLAFSNVAYTIGPEDGEPVLSVTGRLTNVTSHELPIPMLRVDLSDDAKRSLYHWSFDAGAATLLPGMVMDFTTRLSNPPMETRHLQVGFADASPDDPKTEAKPSADETKEP